MDNNELPEEYRCKNCLTLMIPRQQLAEYKETIKCGQCRMCKPPKIKRRKR